MKGAMLVLVVIFGCLGLYLGVGVFSLLNTSLAVQNAQGQVWNQIDIGGQKIATLEAQVLGAYNQQLDVVKEITEGRKALAAARANNDLDGALAAVGQLQLNLTALAEASPVTNLTPIQTSLMDETSEVFNQIGYKRQQLIDAQTSYKYNRAVFFLLAGFFPDVEILGSTANPAQPVPTSIFAPTPG